MSATIQLDGHDVYSLRLALVLLGVGSLEAEIGLDAGATPPSGTVELVFAVEGKASISYLVTILPSVGDADAGRESLGRFHLFAVQGKGALRTIVDGTDYTDDVDPRLVVEDLVAGEESDLTAIQDLATIPRWGTSGTRKAALTRLCTRLDLGWRVQPSGIVRVAPEAWPAYATDAPLYTREPDAYGLAELALDAPDLQPGMTILRPNNRGGDPWRVAEVVYSLDDGALRAAIRVQRPEGGQGPQLEQWRAAVGAALPPLRLFVPHLATVVEQGQDGTLGLRLDGRDPPLLSLSSVPMFPGLPGCVITAVGFARVVVQFAGGNEDTPIVTGFEAHSPGATILTGSTAPPVP